MSGTGFAFAPAATPAFVGPVKTRAGFQYWYLACFPDCVIAVRQGALTGLLLGLSGPIPRARFAGLGYFTMAFLMKRGNAKRRQVEADLPNIPTSRLRMEPNLVFAVAQLRSIAIKGGEFAGVVIPDLILETSNGSLHNFGIPPKELPIVSAQLQKMYPALYKRI
ncbi:MAG TPA: hypothetical protein VIH89_16235 [Candidatus Sulfotelmatobacter sp.]|jgi:hypothetical protein